MKFKNKRGNLYKTFENLGQKIKILLIYNPGE
jgi:hypothetical protein